MLKILGIDHIVLTTASVRYGNRYGAQGNGYSFYIKDPEGNEVELKEANTIQ